MESVDFTYRFLGIPSIFVVEFGRNFMGDIKKDKKKRRKFTEFPEPVAEEVTGVDSDGKRRAGEANLNPFTGRNFSAKYHEILTSRQSLPVFSYKEKFLKLLRENQIVLLVGQTGSGRFISFLSGNSLCLFSQSGFR